jgi:hypothetical protein
MKDIEELPTIHYSEMAEPAANSPIYREAQTFRRELPRLLAEGHEGKWALIKGDEVIGLLETFDEGYRVGRERFLLQPFIVQPVRERQPLIHTTAYLRHATPQLSTRPGWNGSASDDRPQRSGHGGAGQGGAANRGTGSSEGID